MGLDNGTFTVGEALDHIGFGRFQAVLSFLLGIFLISDAMELMLLSVLGTSLNCEWGISDYEQASLTTVVFASEYCYRT